MPFVGIDFGTSNSVCYVCKRNNVQHVTFGMDENLLPSCVYKKGDKAIVGKLAKECKQNYTVIRNVKRLIGKKYDSVDHKDDVKIYGANAVKGTDGYCWFTLDDGNLYSCVDIASFVFATIKEHADKLLDNVAAEAIISVPAYYSGIQRECIREAAVKAGWNVMHLVNEPTAAAVSYGGDNVCRNTILVFDLGGGTLDVTILSLKDGVYRVESTYGDDSLGGNDFSLSLLHLVEELFETKYGYSIWSAISQKNLKQTTKRIMHLIEEAKESLSLSQQTDVDLSGCMVIRQQTPSSSEDDSDEISFNISRSQFEERIKPLLNRCLAVTKKAMVCGKRKFTSRDIDEVIMIGGSSKIPAVVSTIKNGSIGKSFPIINVMEEVAKGCCECARKHNRPDFRIFESLHTSIGIIYDEDKVFEIFPYGTELPCTKNLTFYCNVPGAVHFRTQLVEIRDVEEKQRRELKTLESSNFLPNLTGYKELLFSFTITSESILIVKTTAMPENEKCLNVYVDELSA
ncbi:chaperone HSP70 [Blastocystis sp. subtype 4]|uniref:chaperone HSP70 n=1 Tax=Blastocystis sp. subtype 4 TaxID=944170 RepID=UPI0007115D5D|nr:chaperone HSP70 [Blastocystis sp. subtype 4]KNB43071.1 chaperone HSP70 [Blastocystis sp. subtype 4]|eukprot:XP_014526514.1 chaperone HSP70 [Blastocystis sp. subtype 4]